MKPSASPRLEFEVSRPQHYLRYMARHLMRGWPDRMFVSLSWLTNGPVPVREVASSAVPVIRLLLAHRVRLTWVVPGQWRTRRDPPNQPGIPFAADAIPGIGVVNLHPRIRGICLDKSRF